MKKQLSHVVGAAMLAAGVAVAPGVVSPQPVAAMTVYDPSNHAENLASKLQLIKQYEKQLQQYETQLKQLAKLDPSQLSESVRQVQEVVSEMNNIRTSINAIGTDFKQAQQQFDETFTDFSKWNGASARDYANQADKINAAVDDGIRQSILSQGLASPEEMQKTSDSLSALLEASQNADGIVGVTQAASQIAGLQVREMQRMEAIMADSMKGQNLYLKKLMQSDEASAKLAEEFYQNNDLRPMADANHTERTADFER